MTLTPWSYTKLRAFETCPRKGRAQYISRELPYRESEAAREGNKVHKLLEDRVSEGAPLPAEYAWLEAFIPVKAKEDDILIAEPWLHIGEDGHPCKRTNAWFTAKIDLLNIEDMDLAVIIDWKTGKPWEDPDQLNVYAALVKAHYPYVRHWRGFYVWLKTKAIGEVHTLSPAVSLRKMKERTATVDTSDTPKKSKLCPFCPLERCEFYTGEKL